LTPFPQNSPANPTKFKSSDIWFSRSLDGYRSSGIPTET